MPAAEVLVVEVPVAAQSIPELVLDDEEPEIPSLELVPDSEWDSSETQPAPVVTLAGKHVPTEDSPPTTPISLVPAPRQESSVVAAGDPWARPADEVVAVEPEDVWWASVVPETESTVESPDLDLVDVVIEDDVAGGVCATHTFDPLLDPLPDPLFAPGDAPSEELEPVFLAAAQAQRAAEQAARESGTTNA